MDFIFGSNETEKTTCLLEMANKFIIENGINSKNGYILLFTPPHYLNMNNNNNNPNKNNRNENEYNFIQHLTRYMPNIKDNMDLIKGYELKNVSYAFGLIDNFRLLSYKSKGLKLILIDDLYKIIDLWVNEIIDNKAKSAKNNDEKKNSEDKLYTSYIYYEIFHQFLSKITSLQKFYQIQCFITINLNICDHINYIKISQRIFKAIFPFIRTSYYLSKLPNEDIIIFNEFRISLNLRNEKYEYNIIENENEEKDNNENNIYENDIDYIYLKEFIEKKKKKNKKYKNTIKLDEVNNWMKNTIREFVNNINKYKIFKKQLEEQKKLEEDSSFTQFTQYDK